MITRSLITAVFYSSVLMLAGLYKLQAQVSYSKKGNVVEIDNGMVKATFTAAGNTISQQYFGRDGNEWILTAESFRPQTPLTSNPTKLFNSSLNQHRFLVAELLSKIELLSKDDRQVTLQLKGEKNGTFITQLVTLSSGNNYFHFDVTADLTGKPAKLDYLLSTFTFHSDKIPSFIHTPGLKFDNEDSKQDRFKLLPAQDQVIGDRAFHSPAIILQNERLFTALVPDLNAINQYAIVSPDARRTIDISRNKFSVPFEDDKYTMPTGLDLNVQSGYTKKPVMTFGLMDNIIAHHIRYQRTNDSSMVRTLNSNKARYAFDLFVSAQLRKPDGFQMVAAHQWKMYGHPVFMNRPHLAFPFEEYERIVDSITMHPIHSKTTGLVSASDSNRDAEQIDVPLKGYDDNGSWLQFDLNGLPVGGYRSAIPWWNDVIHNSTFWNNARDAAGFYFWGKQLKKEELIDRAHRIINFCLSAPRNDAGLFATLYNANTKTWGLQFSDPPHGKNQFFLRDSKSYDVAAMSKTGAHLIDYYLRCEKDERIVKYLAPYADWLLTAINKRGAVPSYVNTDMTGSDLLLYSAQPAVSMWFLAAYYNATKGKKYSNGAKQIAAFLEKEILPEAKWIDMEQYYSCGKKPLQFQRDVWQHEVARGNLANIWACEGFAALYDATGDRKYLKMGEECVDYISFSQCSWEPHFIYTAFPFGGFTADNSDNATMLDARQAEMVKPFIWYGKNLGRQDLVERGVAAAKSSVVLMNLPEHKENNLYRHTNIYPYGLGPENIDHEAHPQSAMRTHPSWGEGSGVFTGLAEAYRELQGGYVDFKKNIAVGVNGIVIDSAAVSVNNITLSIRNDLSRLRAPWRKDISTTLEILGLDQARYSLSINGIPSGTFSADELKSLAVKVKADGKIETVSRVTGDEDRSDRIDFDFLAMLSTVGIFDAAKKINLDVKSCLYPLATVAGHPYRRYRWSVGYHQNGSVMISALPPEEEMGWTPWERWYLDEKGRTRKDSWVLYPAKNVSSSGVARWYKLADDGLQPRFLNKPATLEAIFQRARIDEAAKVLGFDANEMLIKPLKAASREYYENCRWVVIPHILGADGPVIYILPPMNEADVHPWESWYSDGKTALIHHPHFTKKTPLTTQQWREYPNAPQRPPEIFGLDWYWYNDKSLKPTMLTLDVNK